jgi:ABC-2 type transport system ATP-binding protein
VSTRVIETEGLQKRFGPTVAVADLSITLGAGEVFGFLGPNGAGKTTSVKMLLGLVVGCSARHWVIPRRASASAFSPNTFVSTTP